MTIETMMAEIVTHGIRAKGKKEMIDYLKGKRLTRSRAILANCYDCMGGYTDGKYSCRMHYCPLYPWMPYKNKER